MPSPRPRPRPPLLRRLLASTGVAATVATLLTVPAAAPAAAADTVTLGKAAYYDKVLAGIIGEVGGFLSGYEFAAPNDAPHPDAWFEPANGPYAGNFTHFTPGDPATYTRLLAPGRVRGQDNYFMGYFNQHVLEQRGTDPSDEDIRAEYLEHGIKDYGGSDIAAQLIERTGMKPFQTGEHAFNAVSWCCEPYIETDTLGFSTPGMPRTAAALTEKFARISGSFDTTTWSVFMSTLMSQAFLTDDARTALSQAAASLPEGSWPAAVHRRAVQLHAQNPTDWRWAQRQLAAERRRLYGADDDRVIADLNQGTVILAILYGNNDYLDTLRIASIGGNEGVDNAAPIGALMGIVKGMSGTPQAFLDKIWAGGQGIFVNDTSGALRTYVSRDYPAEQKWSDLARLHQGNAEAAIRAGGGTVGTDSYTIRVQDVPAPVTVPAANPGFETGNLDGWTASDPSHAKAERQVGSTDFARTTLAHSGDWKGTVFTDAGQRDVSLGQTVGPLVPGARYRVRAYVASVSGADAGLYADPGAGGAVREVSAFSTEDMGAMGPQILGRAWAAREVEFTATASTATVGLRLAAPGGAWANIDDLTVERVSEPATVRYEAESASTAGGAAPADAASASGGRYLGGLTASGASGTLTVRAPSAGQYRLLVHYTSTAAPDTYRINLNGDKDWPLPAHLGLRVNGSDAGAVYFPRTAGRSGAFPTGTVAVPVTLAAGANTVAFAHRSGSGDVQLDRMDLSAFPEAVTSTAPNPGAGGNLLRNGGFDAAGPGQDPLAWSTWAGQSGGDADADYTEAGSADGSLRLTQQKSGAYEVYTSQTVTGLPAGRYTVRARVMGGGGQTAAYLDVKGHGGADRRADLPQTGWPNWSTVQMTGVQVTSGQATVGFYSKASGGRWVSVDDVEFFRESDG
ncbi:ADP-ribosylglycohydrolase family protein [Streptomyces sp. NPDC060194]|uniref:ADP-ribosylglycohydrolase family protein n=1 Tax=Streptomyces sp. NPDC060194 TaxID=3347069 RepID=UPI003663F1B8